MGNFDQIKNLFLFVKDKHGRYLDCNENLAAAFNMESSHQVVGKTDDMLVCPEQAKLYQSRDALVLRGQHLNNLLEPQDNAYGRLNILVTKSPLYNKSGDIIGVTGFFTNITDKFSFVSDVQITDNGGLFLGQHFGSETLSPREHELLKYVLEGVETAQILQVMAIKRSTYNSLYERIKIKTGCFSKGDLIHACNKSGITYLFM